MPAGLALPALPGRRQHEHSMAVLQDAPVELAPGAVAARGFFVRVEADHPDASSPTDLAFVDRTLALPEAAPPSARDAAGTAPAGTLFTAGRPLDVEDLGDDELDIVFGAERRALETDGGAVLSFFAGEQRHVVTRAKELGVLRPHGQVLRTGDGLVPAGLSRPVSEKAGLVRACTPRTSLVGAPPLRWSAKPTRNDATGRGEGEFHAHASS